MGSIKTIYLSDHANESLKILREKQERFNLSGFICNSLINFSGSSNRLSEDVVYSNLSNWKGKLQEVQENLRFWEDKEKKLDVQKELDRQLKVQTVKEKEEMDEIMDQAKKNIFETFKEETNKEMTEQQYGEYTSLDVNKQRVWKNIWAFSETFK